MILSLGVRPETALAKTAGLELGERGGIRVDEHMRTSDPDIFAVGDVVEVKDYVTGEWALVALAGPANRQGRIAADVIAGRDSRYRGTQGTSVIGLFGATIAWTGVNEKTLQRRGAVDYEKIYIYPNSHAGYYPGAKTIAMKVIFRKSDGRLLGAQALGEDGVDKRIDVLAMATADGRNDLRPGRSGTLLRASVRKREGSRELRRHGGGRRPQRRHAARATGTRSMEHSYSTCGSRRNWRSEQAPGAVNIPLPQLRSRLGELPRDREILVICRSGQRAYYATRILLQNGFKARDPLGRIPVAGDLVGGLRRTLWARGNPPVRPALRRPAGRTRRDHRARPATNRIAEPARIATIPTISRPVGCSPSRAQEKSRPTTGVAMVPRPAMLAGISRSTYSHRNDARQVPNQQGIQERPDEGARPLGRFALDEDRHDYEQDRAKERLPARQRQQIHLVPPPEKFRHDRPGRPADRARQSQQAAHDAVEIPGRDDQDETGQGQRRLRATVTRAASRPG